ncbi:MAG: hypothetical protein IPP48_15750 [Chitinophagaceae bacterium]|nr:hypothetical protein [Chitinophagaceae bacterium]
MQKVHFIKAIFFYFFLLLIKFSFAQTPSIVKPNNTNVIRVPKETQPSTRQINTPDAPISLGVLNKEVLNYFANSFSLLQFSNYVAGGAEFPTYWEFNKTAINEISEAYPKTKNWKKTLTWRKIPAGTAFGLWQISTQPFSLINDPNFTGVIRKGEIIINGVDSVYFEVNYTDDENMESREKLSGLKNKINPVQAINTPKQNNQVNNNTRATANRNSTTKPMLNLSLSKFKVFGNGTRKFYIRLIPLDANKKPLEKYLTKWY